MEIFTSEIVFGVIINAKIRFAIAYKVHQISSVSKNLVDVLQMDNNV